MTREKILRDSDALTVDLAKQDAEQAHITAKAKRAILVDSTGTIISSVNPLPITATITTGDIEIGAVEIKNATDDTRAVVKTDGTNNALVVMQNSVPTTTVTATNLDIRDLTSISDSVEVKQSTASNLNANVSATHLDIRHLNNTDDTVNVGTVTTLPSITGTVTANAGTNLNTSALSTSANQTTIIQNLQALNSLVPSTYDYISLSYTGSNLTGVVFKTGGASGTIVSTLTLAYSGSNLISVTKT
jgi:hypothetical protein